MKLNKLNMTPRATLEYQGQIAYTIEYSIEYRIEYTIAYTRV